jgi:hypothetical protein
MAEYSNPQEPRTGATTDPDATQGSGQVQPGRGPQRAAGEPQGWENGLAPYPSNPAPAFRILADWTRGADTTRPTADVAHAGWHVLGWGLSVGLPVDVLSATRGAAAEANVDLRAAGGDFERMAQQGSTRGVGAAPVVGAIPWAVLIPAVLQILQLFLKKRQ